VKRRRKTTASPEPDRRSIRLVGLAIFAAALATRLLFWQATPDRAWGWTAYFKGDAPLWLEWARAIELGTRFELGLPIHPPGAAYLVALLWNGHESGIPFLRFAWAAIGALVPLGVFLAAERSFGLCVAVFAGCWTALSSGLLTLSTSINNETPYLVLAVASVALTADLRDRPQRGQLALWSAVNGLACLFRVEHALFWILALALLGAGWVRRGRSGAFRWIAASVFFFALPLVPWHVEAWNAVARFNRELPPSRSSYGERVGWEAGALRARDELPAFARPTSSEFVAATVARRGGTRVRAEDFAILEEAFGDRPRSLHRFPFISSYGPLNFALANSRASTGGFDRTPLELAPPLAGGASRYPTELIAGLPPSQLSFVYPPHLSLVNDGYSIGARWIREHPGHFVRLAVKKLAIFWSGAASGLTGWNFPMGLAGRRRAVDMVTPEPDAPAVVWQIAVLGGCVAGLVAAARQPAIVPWLVFLATKVVVTVLFFGYVRTGATVIPIVAVLLGLAGARWLASRAPKVVAAALIAGVVFEAARLVAKPAVSMDGRAVVAADPFPGNDAAEHRIDVSIRRE
jgi:hypothetical protein